MTVEIESEKGHKISVSVKRNKVEINNHGMVNILKGHHYTASSIRADILERDYILPKGITIDV